MVDGPESGAVAGGGRDGVIDAAGDGPAQVAGEGQSRRQPLSPITLTGGLKRLGVRRASIMLRSFDKGALVADPFQVIDVFGCAFGNILHLP